MSPQHRELALGRWQAFPFFLQMAHLGSEVERALKWHGQRDVVRFRPAYERSLELLDLTLSHAGTASRARELARLREALVDYFDGANEMGSSPALWRSYFDPFTFAARRDR